MKFFSNIFDVSSKEPETPMLDKILKQGSQMQNAFYWEKPDNYKNRYYLLIGYLSGKGLLDEAEALMGRVFVPEETLKSAIVFEDNADAMLKARVE